MKPGFKQTEVGMIPEDWEIRRLSDIAVANWGNTSITKNSYQESGYQAYSASGPDGYVGWYEFDFPAVILSAIGAQCGKTWLAKGKWTPIKNTIWFTAKEGAVNTPYLFRITGDPGFWPNRGQAQPFIALNDVRDSRIPLPPTLAEQEAIASALGDADALIESLERLIAKKRDVKQGAMQELLTARRRLPGFTGKWETKRLGEIGVFLKGSGVKKDEAQDGTLPCIRYGEIYTTHEYIVRTFCSWISHSVALTATRLQSGDILFAGSGETKEEIGKCAAFVGSEEAYAGGDIVILRPFNSDSCFLGYYLNSVPINKQKASMGQGDAIVHIGTQSLASIAVVLPSPTEQTAIAAVLSDMDAELAALEAKLSKARAIKQGMMQELLTGRIRLK